MKPLKLFLRSREAKLRSGVGYLNQLAEMISLVRSPNFVGPEEYYEFGLYDRKLSKEEKHKFIGYKAERYYSRLNRTSWDATANDKILFEQIMRASGFASPKNLAVLHPWRSAGADCEHIRSIVQLHSFLSDKTVFPMFVKPVHGLFGRGTAILRSYTTEKQTVAFQSGCEMRLEEFFSWLGTQTRDGMLFQKMLKPSDEVRKVCGSRLSTVRMIVLCDRDKPTLFRANWKICTGYNLVDNTDGWRNGNVVAAVDHLNGMVHRAFQGRNGERVEVLQHPDTHAPIVGIKVPNWDEIKAYVEAVARVFLGVRFQAWDIAASSDGIQALELNLATFHTVYATQLVSKKGFLDDRLAKVMAEEHIVS